MAEIAGAILDGAGKLTTAAKIAKGIIDRIKRTGKPDRKITPAMRKTTTAALTSIQRRNQQRRKSQTIDKRVNLTEGYNYYSNKKADWFREFSPKKSQFIPKRS